ncbi:MAG: ComEC/Rec2 family competence protein [Deltaproteobacteria bacterium]|nr:ComEC/Rec2 family competence protein [Deltaproteobacteria bacterium]
MDRPVPMAALAFGAGVLGVPLSWIAGGVCLLLVRDGRQRRRRLHPSVPSYSGFAGLVLLVAAAALGSLRARQEAQGLAALRNGAAWMDGREEALEGTVLDAPADTRGGCRVLLGLRDPSNTLVQLQIACPCPPYRPGDVLRGRARFLSWKPPANPGEFDLGSYRRARGIAGLAVCSLPPFLVGFDTEHPGSVAGLVADLRGRIRRGLDGAELSPDAAGLALALVVGDRSSVPDELGRDFSRSGLAHLLAISGLHLALTAGLVLSLARLVLLPMARRLSPGWLLGAPYAVLVPVVCLQTALAGAPPSCLRAATMIIHLCAARLLGRRGDSASSLGLAALVCLSVQPSALREAGFQLSFAATAAILWIPPPAPSPGAAWWRRLARSAFGLLRVSLAATLGTAPLVAWHFGTLPVLGPLANLVAVPVASLALLPAALLAGTWSGATGTAPPLPLSMVLEAACGIEALAARTASIEGWVLPMLPRDLPGLVLAGGPGSWC